MRMVSPSFSGAVVRTGGLADHDRPIGLEHFEQCRRACRNRKKSSAARRRRSRRKQNVVRFEQARVIRDEIFRLRGFELETSAQRAGAAAQIEQIQLAVVVENDPILERRFDLRPGLQLARR